jgi:hypothetical protein
MNTQEVVDITYSIIIVTTFLMVVILIATFCKVLDGIRFGRIFTLIVILIAANILYFIAGFAEYDFIANFTPQFSFFVGHVDAITSPIADLLFCEAHWLYAFYYWKVAKNIPRVLKGDPNDKPKDYF